MINFGLPFAYLLVTGLVTVWLWSLAKKKSAQVATDSTPTLEPAPQVSEGQRAQAPICDSPPADEEVHPDPIPDCPPPAEPQAPEEEPTLEEEDQEEPVVEEEPDTPEASLVLDDPPEPDACEEDADQPEPLTLPQEVTDTLEDLDVTHDVPPLQKEVDVLEAPNHREIDQPSCPPNPSQPEQVCMNYEQSVRSLSQGKRKRKKSGPGVVVKGVFDSMVIDGIGAQFEAICLGPVTIHSQNCSGQIYVPEGAPDFNNRGRGNSIHRVPLPWKQLYLRAQRLSREAQAA